MPEYVGAVDQGTTSTRFLIFDRAGEEVARHQLEHDQLMPRPGWLEHDPTQIWQHTISVIKHALGNGGLAMPELAAIGVTNQRETTVVWNRHTGVPYCNAIVWQDTRTDQITDALNADCRGQLIRERTGLRPAPYFSAGKLQWVLQNVPGVRRDAEAGEAVFGTVDSWLIWNLTGGPDGGVHVTDVTNASRTMLMDLRTLEWDPDLLDIFGVPRQMLPAIRPSSDPTLYGRTDPRGPLGAGVPVAAALGDQQAAMIGQVCFEPGDAKNTYGTGSFLLLNTGHELVHSDHGLLSTVCYQLGKQPPVYALEGSMAVTGSAVQWLRDQVGIITDAAESERLAGQVPDSGGCYFVPAFSGLFAPHWRSDARGVLVGLSRFNNRAHIARAVLEAICYQTLDVARAMERDSGVTLGELKVDGGVTANELCMQIQADVLGVPVSRPHVAETTALGAGYAAGLAVGLWTSPHELRSHWKEDKRWDPTWTADQRAQGVEKWQRAVDRSLGWVDL